MFCNAGGSLTSPGRSPGRQYPPNYHDPAADNNDDGRVAMNNVTGRTTNGTYPIQHNQSRISAFGDAYSISHGGSRLQQGITDENNFRLHDEMEVDYDSGATPLYKCIEGRDWDGAVARIEVAPTEASTWISRKDHHSGKIRWRLLPIHATCIFRSPLALIELLLKAYNDGPQMKDDQGMLPIHLACRNGASKGVVLTLLSSFPESINIKDRKGRLPIDLVESSTSQNKEAVAMAMRKFISDGQHKKAPTSSFSPLKQTRSMLSMNKVGPNEVDYEHRTVLFRQVLKKDWNSSSERAKAHPDEAATWIVTKGFNGNLRFLPIHKACVLQPNDAVVEALLDAYDEGAKAKDQDGWLPIHCACFYNASESVINKLIESYPKGAQTKDDEGRLPLHYACLKSSPKQVIDILLSHFPKGSMSKDDEGRLPIHHACSKGASEHVIDALLKASPKGAQSKDDQGRLPLHHACRKNATEHAIRSLLKVCPRATQVKDDQEKLPIHYACSNGASPNVVSLLLATYPESINVKNGFGYTPLAEARAAEANTSSSSKPNNNDDDGKIESTIKILEKFKIEQDRIKADSSENRLLEAKVAQLSDRVLVLESTIKSISHIGSEMKQNLEKEESDPYILLSKFADSLISIGNAVPSSSYADGSFSSPPGSNNKPPKGRPSPGKKRFTVSSPLRFGRKNNIEKSPSPAKSRKHLM